MFIVRLAYTLAVMAAVVALASNGQPLGGLVIVPLAAVWLRGMVESGRPAALARR